MHHIVFILKQIMSGHQKKLAAPVRRSCCYIHELQVFGQHRWPNHNPFPLPFLR